MQTGKINVHTENIFPIIKKFLYSDHEIFLRELVSNAVDASQKIKTLASAGEFTGELGELKVEPKLGIGARFAYVSLSGRTEAPVMKLLRQLVQEHLRAAPEPGAKKNGPGKTSRS